MLPQALIVATAWSLAPAPAPGLELVELGDEVGVPLLHAVPTSNTAAAKIAASARVVHVRPAVISASGSAIENGFHCRRNGSSRGQPVESRRISHSGFTGERAALD
jgi:hypothetical protein